MASSQAPDLVDINGDGNLEVVMSDQRGGIIVVNAMTGETIKRHLNRDLINGVPIHYLDTTRQRCSMLMGMATLSMLLADGDHPEYGENAYVFDLVDWKVDAILPVGLAKFPPTIGDVTGDGVPDIISVKNNSTIVVFDNQFNQLQELPAMRTSSTSQF